LGVLSFLSPIAVWAMYHGQTAILSAAGLLLLFHPEQAPRRPWLSVLVLWALTAKPPLAITAGAVLLARGDVRTVVGAVILTAATPLCLQPLLGPHWVGDYLTLIGHYNVEEADPAFAWCLAPTYMSNLRAVLFGAGMDDALASRISTLAWIGSLGGIVLA